MFIKIENPNRYECVLNALSTMFGKTQDEIKTELSKYMGDNDEPDAYLIERVWGKYLEDNGFRKVKIKNESTANRIELKILAERLSYQGARMIALGSQHVVCIKDCNYYDTWDSGNVLIFYYYIK